MDITIVGGGIAGLWVARELSKRSPGNKVRVIEKNTRLGGRVLTSAKYGYEIGAGRIHNSHRHVRALVRRYGLTEVPISGDSQWYALGSDGPEPNQFSATWGAFIKVLERLPAHELRRHTLHQLAVAVLGPKGAATLLEKYPYRAETERMRADVGVIAFQQEMRGDADFFVVGEGLSAIIKGLEEECRGAGVEILLGETVADVRRVTGNDGWSVRTESGVEFVSDRVVLAMPVAALRQLPVLRGWDGLGRLGMEPLTRIYAKYPSLSWYSGPKTVTDSPLRYVIPINREEGTIMISYTDDRDTRFWKSPSPSSAIKGLKDGRELTTAIQREVRRLWPRAPQPEWVHRYEWSTGCSYWRPGDYEPTAVIREALELQPGLHICGESFSLRQAWVEGGLESAAELLERLI